MKKPTNESINEHDMTKKMIDIMKEGLDTASDDGVIEISGEEKKAEEDKLKEVVGETMIQFNVFNVYPEANNVVFGGQFQGYGGLQFQFTLEDTNGFYITANNVQVTTELLTMMQKLKGYYEGWKGDMSELLTDYQRNV